MKILALTSDTPPLRYRSILQVLEQLGIDVYRVTLDGWAWDVRQRIPQLRILRKKGFRKYLQWRRNNQSGRDYRKQVSEYIGGSLNKNGWTDFKSRSRRSFGGLGRPLIKLIEIEKPDYLFQLGAGIVPESFIKRVPPILNLHPGILPGIRGLDPLFWAHYYGQEPWLGSTLHIIDAGIDTGRPLLRRRIAAKKNGHYADSVIQQTGMERELLKIFFRNSTDDLPNYDCGGAGKTAYRGMWCADEYEKLVAANWWEAERL